MVQSGVKQRRGVELVAKVLAAAVDEISEHGYAGFSMESVAARAEVNKTTVYRRWPTKEALMRDAFESVLPAAIDVPDTGKLVDDLVLIGVRLGAGVRTRHGRALYVLFVEHGPGADSTLQLPSKDGYRMRSAVQRGVDRGELPPATDVELFTLLYTSAIMQSALLRAEAPTKELCRRTIDLLVAGNAAVTKRRRAEP